MSEGLNQIVWTAIESTPSKLLWYASLGVMLEGVVTGANIIGRYLECFYHSDPRYTVSLVFIAGLCCLVQLGLNAWQCYRLIEHVDDDMPAFLRIDMRANMFVVLLVGVANISAITFYSRRAWLLAGRKRRYLPLYGISVVAVAGLSLAVIVQGYLMPNITLDNLARLDKWLKGIDHTVTAWAVVSVVMDVGVCATMMAMLWKSRPSFHLAEGRLLRKLLTLTFETMTPPMLLVLVQLCIVLTQGSSLGNFSRVVLWTIGPLYLHSILYSLVSREDLKNILANPDRGRRRNADGQAEDPQPLPIQLVSMEEQNIKVREAHGGDGEVGGGSSTGDAFQVRLGPRIV